MGPRVSAARKQLETRIRNDEIYRESERKLTKDFERKLNNWWRLRDEVCKNSNSRIISRTEILDGHSKTVS